MIGYLKACTKQGLSEFCARSGKKRKGVASGIYFYRIKGDEVNIVRRRVLMR